MKLAQKDKKVILIIGDVGFKFIEPFREKYPNQFLNAGAAEQNMMGMAHGLTRVGWKPYVYSMVNFICIRPLEQVRNDLANQNSNVKLFGVLGGPSYGFLGFSHNISEDEDVRLMSPLPNMNVYIPKTEEEVPDIMMKEYERKGPSYTRI